MSAVIDVIIHNGAMVHWLLPYEKLKAPNVGGTHEVCRLVLSPAKTDSS
jgi:thioester reductase-like protein